MKERHSLYWMCEVHALNIVCMCAECVLTRTYDELAQVSPHRISESCEALTVVDT